MHGAHVTLTVTRADHDVAVAAVIADPALDRLVFLICMNRLDRNVAVIVTQQLKLTVICGIWRRSGTKFVLGIACSSGGRFQGRQYVEDLLRVETPELLWPDAVPQHAWEPQGHSDLHRPKDYIMGIATAQINSGKSPSCTTTVSSTE